MNSQDEPNLPVLVGIADTASGWAALEAAVHIAQQEHAPLLLVHVWRDVDWFLSARRTDLPELVRGRKQEQAFFAAATAHARRAAPDLEISGEFAPGSLYGVLLERSESARLLVLGTSTSEDGPGSVGTWYLAHARCPVVVVDADGETVTRSDGAASVRMSRYG